MHTKEGYSVLSWKLSLAETLAFGSTVVIVTIWSFNTFLAKADAVTWQHNVEKRIEVLEDQMESIRETQKQIAVDVSYIRGRMEPSRRN